MFLYDKTNILEGSGIFEVDFAPSHGPATVTQINQSQLQVKLLLTRLPTRIKRK